MSQIRFITVKIQTKHYPATHKTVDYDTYQELLNLYDKLLEQEDINDNFITEFITYEKISDSALKLISND